VEAHKVLTKILAGKCKCIHIYKHTHMYLYICIYTHIHTHIYYIYTCIYINTHTNIYVHTYMNIYIHIPGCFHLGLEVRKVPLPRYWRENAHIHIYIYIHTHIYTCIYIYTHTHICAYICVHICTYTGLLSSWIGGAQGSIAKILAGKCAYIYMCVIEEISLKIFASPDCTVSPQNILSDRDSVCLREILFEIFGTPDKTFLICTGTPVKTCWKFWQL